MSITFFWSAHCTVGARSCQDAGEGTYGRRRVLGNAVQCACKRLSFLVTFGWKSIAQVGCWRPFSSTYSRFARPMGTHFIPSKARTSKGWIGSLCRSVFRANRVYSRKLGSTLPLSYGCLISSVWIDYSQNRIIWLRKAACISNEWLEYLVCERLREVTVAPAYCWRPLSSILAAASLLSLPHPLNTGQSCREPGVFAFNLAI